VSRFLVYSLLGPNYASGYGQAGERIHHLAVAGIRLVIEQFRTDVIKTLKDGSRGKLRIDYGDAKQPEKPIAWLWKFIDGAKSAGELFCGSEARTDRSETGREGLCRCRFFASRSVRTGWDRREPCSRRCLRRCRSRVALRSAYVRPGISAIGASAMALTSSSRRRIRICDICVTAAGGRWGRRRSTRATSRSSLTGAPAGSFGLTDAARRLDDFVLMLRNQLVTRPGRGVGRPRGHGRINHILVSVREMYKSALAHGVIGEETMAALFVMGQVPDPGISERPVRRFAVRPRHVLAGRTAGRGQPGEPGGVQRAHASHAELA
jgi:hypothetical protein